ncbi:MAG: hypothetical protein SVK08_01515 [Halobacteriota archaeon]|nr:hypothetical protein [Halobacteriota archaeon]
MKKIIGHGVRCTCGRGFFSAYSIESGVELEQYILTEKEEGNIVVPIEEGTKMVLCDCSSMTANIFPGEQVIGKRVDSGAIMVEYQYSIEEVAQSMLTVMIKSFGGSIGESIANARSLARKMLKSFTKKEPATMVSQCPGCGVIPGKRHLRGCAIEMCSVCGKQKCQCHCIGHDREFARWTGICPGVAEAFSMGIDYEEFMEEDAFKCFFVKPKEERS